MPYHGMTNYYWLSGDRFFCLETKNKIIAALKEKNGFLNVESIEETDDVNLIASKISSSGLWDSGKTIYVYDGKLPSNKKIISLIENLPVYKKLIHIEQKIIKTTEFFKKFESRHKHFSPATSKNLIAKEHKNQIKQDIKDHIGWNGNNHVFNFIFEKSDYDYGKTINEIEKLGSIIDLEKVSSEKEIEEFIYSEESANFLDLPNIIKKGDMISALKYIETFSYSDFFEIEGISILMSLIEYYTFVLYATLAKKEGCSSDSEISNFIFEQYYKNGEKQDRKKIENRLFFEKRIINDKTDADIALTIKNINLAIKECIERKYTKKFIFYKLIYSII